MTIDKIETRFVYFLKLLSFDLQLENFGVDLNQLKLPATQRIFRAWFEDWEQNNLKEQDCVIEANFLAKYKYLLFLDPDSELTFTVASENCEYHCGKKGGWHLISEPNDDDGEAEAWDIELACELIGKTKQLEGIGMMSLEADGATSDGVTAAV